MFKRHIETLTVVTLTSVATFIACQPVGESRKSPGGEEHVAGDGTPPETTVVDEQFLANALRNLAATLGSLNLADLDLQVALRVAAEHVLSNPHAVDTTGAVRTSLITAAEVIEADDRGDGSLRQSAESLRPDRPLSDQGPALRDFFRTSVPAVRRAAASRDGRE